MQQSKPCLHCSKTIIKRQNESLKDWENRHRFCSRSCSALYNQNGKSTRFYKGMKAPHPIKKGQHISPSTQFKKGHVPWHKDKKGVMPTPWNKDKRFTQITG